MGKQSYLSEGLKERLKQARMSLAPKRGEYVSQEALAAEVGLTGVTLGNYEGGITEPSLQIIERLAAVLGVSPSWLAFGVAGGDVADPPHNSDRSKAPPVKLTPVRKSTESDKRRKQG